MATGTYSSQAQVHAIIQIAAAILDLREEHLQRGVSLAKQYDTFRTPGRSRLRDLHTKLDAAVFAAYDFNPADDGLAQLLALNQDIAATPESARGPGARGFTGVRVTHHRIQPPVG